MSAAPHTQIQQRVHRGLAWIGAASSMVALLDIATTFILLAFWISQEQLGVATLAISMFPLLDLATDLGIMSAVIQRDDHSVEKISTVFWLNLLVSIVMFAGLALGAPVLARTHGHPEVGYMLTAYGGKLIFQNAYTLPAALMKRELRFKELSVIRILANVAEAIGKIAFAAAGLGVWCFVLGAFCRVLVTAAGINICHPWRPRLLWRFGEALDYFKFGLKTSASQILYYFYTYVDYQVVGWYFGARALGLYTLAYNIVLEPVRVISNVVIEVAFPAFARLRRSRAQLVEQFIAFTRMNLVTVLPFLAVVFLAADDLIVLFVGADWLPAAPAVRILCLVGVLRALSHIVPPLLDGLGYPAHTLIYTTVASIVLSALYVLFAETLGDRLGYLSVAWAWAAGYPVAFAVLAYLAMRKIALGPLEYLRRTVGIPACTAAALAAGAAAHALVPRLSAGLRLGVVAAVVLVVLGLLLAYLQGISPRSIARSLSAPPGGE